MALCANPQNTLAFCANADSLASSGAFFIESLNHRISFLVQLRETGGESEVPGTSSEKTVLTFAQLGAFQDSRFPVWVFDIDLSRVVWANGPALEIWSAASTAELMQRDMAQDMSSSVQARLRQFQSGFALGEVYDEQWTIFPLGKPRVLSCRFRGCLLPDGRLAMLAEAQAIGRQDLNLRRSSQALLYTSVMVTTYSASGECTYANPAARRAFPAAGKSALTRFLNPVLREILAEAPSFDAEGTYLSEVSTSRGMRTHEVEIRQSYDPIEGQRNFLITEIDVTEQQAAKRELANLATQDGLTGLHNRTYLALSAATFIEDSVRRGKPVALLLLDIDRFKFVNDTLGHAAGDELLREIGLRLSAALPEDALLSRLGGDEFCCLLCASEGERAFLRVAATVLKELRRPVIVDSYDLSVSASAGLSMAEAGRVTFDELLRKADLALFDAKGSGGNAVRVFRPELAERSQRFLQVDNELREALSRNRLELFYQPRVCFSSGKIVAAEALIRLNSPSGAAVLPDEFIPVAEATGRISAIGRWALREAARHLVALRQARATINLSVNVSPRQFADPSFLGLLRQLRPTIDADAGDIELEITENILVETDRRLQRVLMQISELGYKLAIDDFGTAYSNLASLTRYPISCIKIDRTLIAHKDFRLLVTGVLTIARAFGARIVAEGVETEVQRQWLEDNLCDEFQGYLFSRPVPFAELVRMVAGQP